MITATLPNGVCYNIPLADVAFFQKLAKRMKWSIVSSKDNSETDKATSWADEFSAQWKDDRTAEQIVSDIHAARTANAEIEL